MSQTPKVLNINGAQVALYPISDLKAVSFRFKIRAGSWYEKGELWGKAHLLEHMFFQGSNKFPNHDAMEIFKEENGIWNNAWTSGSQIDLALRMPSIFIEKGFELVKEILFNLSIPEKELQKEKDVIAQEYDDKWSKPTVRFNRKIDEQRFGPNHPYIRDGVGDIDYVKSLTRDDLLKYQKELFVPVNMSIGIAGNLDTAQTEDALNRLLIVQGSKSLLEFPNITPNNSRLVHSEPNMASATIEIGWQIKGQDTTTLKDRVLLSLSSFILGGSSRSFLFKKIRQQLGLAYNISTSVDFYPTTGLFTISTSVKPDKIETIIIETLKEVSTLIKRPLDKDIFQRAKNYLIMLKQMDYESTMGTASNLASCLFLDNVILSPEEYADIINSFSEIDVRKTLRTTTEKDPIISIMKS